MSVVGGENAGASNNKVVTFVAQGALKTDFGISND